MSTTPITDTAKQTFQTYTASAFEVLQRGGDLSAIKQWVDAAPPDGWKTAAALERKNAELTLALLILRRHGKFLNSHTTGYGNTYSCRGCDHSVVDSSDIQNHMPDCVLVKALDLAQSLEVPESDGMS